MISADGAKVDFVEEITALMAELEHDQRELRAKKVREWKDKEGDRGEANGVDED